MNIKNNNELPKANTEIFEISQKNPTSNYEQQSQNKNNNEQPKANTEIFEISQKNPTPNYEQQSQTKNKETRPKLNPNSEPFNRIKDQKITPIDNGTARFLLWNCNSINKIAKKNLIHTTDAQFILLNEPRTKWNCPQHKRAFFSKPIKLKEPLKTDSEQKYGKINCAFIDRNSGMQTWNLKQINGNDDPNLIITKIGNGKYWIYSILVYITPTDTTLAKNTKQALINELKEIEKSEPNAPICLQGDFNMNLTTKNKKGKHSNKFVRTINKILNVHSLAPFTCTRINKNNETTKSQIDFVATRNCEISNIEQIKKTGNEGWSDHAGFTYDIKFGSFNKLPPKIFPNKKKAGMISLAFKLACTENEELNPSMNSLNNIIDKFGSLKTKITQKRNKHDIKKIEIIDEANNIDEAEIAFKEFYKNIAIEAGKNRFSNKSKEAFKIFKNFTKYGLFQKKNADIITQVKNEKGDFLNDPDEVAEAIMNDYEKLHGTRKGNFPSFPKLNPTEEQIKFIASKFKNTSKAIIYDGIDQSIFKCHKKCLEKSPCKACKISLSLIRSIVTDHEYFNSNEAEKHFKARQIPVSKVAPDIGTPDQNRPIVVQGPICKALELIIAQKLAKANSIHTSTCQTGFKEGLSTSTQLFRLFANLKKKKKNQEIILLDISKAFSSLDFNDLINEIKKKNILNEEETQLLLFLRGKISIGIDTLNKRIEKKGHYGVHQGSALAPHLFSIIFQGALEAIHEKYKAQEKPKTPTEPNSTGVYVGAFADDILIKGTPYQCWRAFYKIREWLYKNHFKQSEGKSVAQIVGGKNTQHYNANDEEFDNMPILDETKYLGQKFNDKLKPKKHLNFIKSKAFYIKNRMHNFFNVNTKLKLNFFDLCINPLFRMLAPIYTYGTKTDRDMIIKAHRGIFKKFIGLKKHASVNATNCMMGKSLENMMKKCFEDEKMKLLNTFNEILPEPTLPMETKEINNTIKILKDEEIKNTIKILNFRRDKILTKLKEKFKDDINKLYEGNILINSRELLQELIRIKPNKSKKNSKSK